MSSSIQIEEQAAQWLVKRDSSEWSGNDEATLAAWLEESTAHMVAFVRLEAAWIQAKRLKALSAGVRPGEVPSPEEWQLAPFFEKAASPDPTVPETASSDSSRRSAEEMDRRSQYAALSRTSIVKRWALAASLLIAIGAGIALYQWPFGSTYRTAVGGIASVPMSDGSKITLNTDSKIRLELTETERRVELEQGEAFFEVAKDASRPFIVTAGSKRVIAVGTQFSVRRDKDDVRVFITEGRVRIEDENEPSAAKNDERKLVTLAAGSIARANGAGVLIQESTIPEVESYLNWRTGYLSFRDTALADAVAEFNRYNTRKIVIEDPAVAAIRLSGKFRSTQSEAFVRLLEDGFPVRAQRVGEQTVLTDSRKTEKSVTASQ